MMYKNKEGYPDPTAGEALRNATYMPPYIWKCYKMLREAAKVAGLKITGIKDIESGKEWKI